jgi:hypothetical protein
LEYSAPVHLVDNTAPRAPRAEPHLGYSSVGHDGAGHYLHARPTDNSAHCLAV